MTYIGKLKHNIIISDNYQQIANADEKAAIILAKSELFEQACYCILQAMEKTIRAKIFTLVDAKNPYFREKNKSHCVENAANFLLDILSSDEIVKKQIKQQMTDLVLKDTKYSFLHNCLRYPNYSEKYNNFSKLTADQSDFDELYNRLAMLKKFLKDLH